MDIRNKALDVIEDHFKWEPMAVPRPIVSIMERRFEDVPECDSLDILELALALEDEFDIDLVDAPITLDSTIGDLIKAVEERCHGRH